MKSNSSNSIKFKRHHKPKSTQSRSYLKIIQDYQKSQDPMVVSYQKELSRRVWKRNSLIPQNESEKQQTVQTKNLQRTKSISCDLPKVSRQGKIGKFLNKHQPKSLLPTQSIRSIRQASEKIRDRIVLAHKNSRSSVTRENLCDLCSIQ